MDTTDTDIINERILMVSTNLGNSDSDDYLYIFDDKGTYCIIPLLLIKLGTPRIIPSLLQKLGNITVIGRSKKLMESILNNDKDYSRVHFETFITIMEKLISCRCNIENGLITGAVNKVKLSKCLYYLNTIIEYVRAVRFQV